jgi:hypothetical protein
METHRFVKEGSCWYIDLPAYLEQGGSKGDLAMVAGADTMLDIMAEGTTSVTLKIDTKPFPQADLLELTEVCHPSQGGGYYMLHTYNNKAINHCMWLCAVTNFVFGSLPSKIYLQKV